MKAVLLRKVGLVFLCVHRSILYTLESVRLTVECLVHVHQNMQDFTQR